MSSTSDKDSSSSFGCDFPVRIKQEPTDDSYGSYSDEQTPGSSGRLGKRKNQPTWSLRELELSDDEGDRKSCSSEYEPSESSEGEASESESDHGINSNQVSSGNKKRRLSHTRRKDRNREESCKPSSSSSFTNNFISRVVSSDLNNPVTSSAPTTSPNYVHFNFINANTARQIQPALLPNHSSIQSIAQAVTASNKSKKPAPGLSPLQFARKSNPEIFLMEKVDEIKILNDHIVDDIEYYTKCLVVFDKIFTRLRSHPTSETKRLVTVELSSLLEIIKTRKKYGNTRFHRERLAKVTSKIHSYLRDWPSQIQSPAHPPSLNNNPTNPGQITTTTTQLNRVGTQIRKVPPLTPVTPGRGGGSLHPKGSSLTTPVAILPKGHVPKSQVHQIASGGAQVQTPFICIDDEDDNVSSLKIKSVKTLATKASNSSNFNQNAGKQGSLIIPNHTVNKITTTNGINRVNPITGENIDVIPWMGLYDADLLEEQIEVVEVLDSVSVVAAEPIFSRGKYPPNVPIFLDNQISTSEQSQVPSDKFVKAVQSVVQDTNQPLQFSSRLKAFAANQSHHHPNSIPTMKTLWEGHNPTVKTLWEGHSPTMNTLWQGHTLTPTTSSSHVDEIITLSDDSDDGIEKNLQNGTTTNLHNMIQEEDDYQFGSSVLATNESEQLDDECVLGI